MKKFFIIAGVGFVAWGLLNTATAYTLLPVSAVAWMETNDPFNGTTATPLIIGGALIVVPMLVQL
jgi:hypothetical protein